MAALDNLVIMPAVERPHHQVSCKQPLPRPTCVAADDL